MKVLGTSKRGLIFILSAPAGTGKTTLVHKLLKEFPSVVQSISYTTREPRPQEKPGKDYHFISRKEFEKKIAEKDFLEHVELYGDYYGTSKKWVEDHLSHGKHVVLVIDTQGALKLMKFLSDACFIFVEPPSLEVLRQRLINRGTETKETIEKRLSYVSHEMVAGEQYQYRIVNEDLEVTYQVLRSILIAEEHKIRHKS